MNRFDILAKGGLDIDGETIRDKSVEVSIETVSEGNPTCSVCEGTAKFMVSAHGRIRHCCGITSCISKTMTEMEALCDAAEQRRWDLISHEENDDEDGDLPQPGLRTLTPEEVRIFQRSAGLEESGQHTRETFEAMLASGKPVVFEQIRHNDWMAWAIRTSEQQRSRRGIPILGIDEE